MQHNRNEADKHPPLFLLSNDDGIHAPGIQTLMKRLAQEGEVWVAAPHTERSAASQMITIWQPLRVNPLSTRVFAIEGSPSDCVMLGLQKLLPRKPDWVITGINRGGNIGTDTLYSGTVAAATEGCLFDVPSIASSLCGIEPVHYDAAAEVVVELINTLDKDAIRGSVVNLNVPDMPREQMRGIKTTSLARRNVFPEFVRNRDPRGREYFWHGAVDQAFEYHADNDFAAINDGYISVSVLARTRYDAEKTKNLFIG